MARKRPFVWLMAMAVGLLATGCEDSAPTPPAEATSQPADLNFGSDAIEALAAANQFCRHWRMRDYESGRSMLSRRLLRKYPDSDMRTAIAGTSNPHHGAFAIFEGQEIGPGRFAFKIRLFLIYTGQRDYRYEAPVKRIVVERDETGQWLIDEFPFLE